MRENTAPDQAISAPPSMRKLT